MKIKYGEHECQYLKLYPPVVSSSGKASPVCFIIHGGYWKNQWTVENAIFQGEQSVAQFMAKKGYVSIEIEYRRRDHEGGGYDGTNEDVLNAFLHLSKIDLSNKGFSMDLDRVCTIGHSAGGQLVLWLAAKLVQLKDESVAYALPALTVAVAPVTDLVRGFNERISDEGDAVPLYMKCDPNSPENIAKYEKASPIFLLKWSVQVPQIVVIGDADNVVPPLMVTDYFAKCKKEYAHASAELIQIEKADHFTPLNAAHKDFLRVYASIERRMIAS